MTRGPQAVVTIQHRRDFLAVRGGRKWGTEGFLLEGKARAAGEEAAMPPRFGFTVTKKLGGAVVRNRIRRRLKAAAAVAGDGCQSGFDYVVVARPAALTMSFAKMCDDFRTALAMVHKGGGRRQQS